MPQIGEKNENVIIDPKNGLDAVLQSPHILEQVTIDAEANTPEQNARRNLAKKRKKTVERRKTRTAEDGPVK